MQYLKWVLGFTEIQQVIKDSFNDYYSAFTEVLLCKHCSFAIEVTVHANLYTHIMPRKA